MWFSTGPTVTRKTQQLRIQRGEGHTLSREASEPNLISPNQVFQRPVNGAEESTPLAPSVLVGELAADRIQALVEPAVVAGQELVLLSYS